MHPAAKKCIQWSIGLFVVGSVLLVYIPEIFLVISKRAGANAAIGLDFMDVTLELVRWTFMPVGASLVGAAVVIQALTSEAKRRADDPLHDRNRNH